MKFFFSILIVIVAAASVYGLYVNKPKTKKRAAEKPLPLVQSVELTRTSEQIFVEAFGTVVPSRKLNLRSEVEGRVVFVNEKLIPGGIVEEGELLIKLDDVDYQLRIPQLQAELTQAEYELELEEGQQVIARQEWQILGGELETLTKEGESLALRKPHLRQARMKVEAAKSKLEAAELEVRRTKLHAPFRGLILEKSVELGQLIGRQDIVLTLVDIDTFWVRVPVPYTKLKRIAVPEGGSSQSPEVTVTWEQGEESITRDGEVLKLLGELDEKGRMAKLLVKVNDPFNLSGEYSGTILLDSFVRVRVSAGEVDGVYSVPRDALQNSRLWFVNSDSRLENRDFTVVWSREDDLLVTAELEPGMELVVSRLSSPLPGMEVVRAGQRNPAMKGNN